jgi:hypothetical protein
MWRTTGTEGSGFTYDTLCMRFKHTQYFLRSTFPEITSTRGAPKQKDNTIVTGVYVYTYTRYEGLPSKHILDTVELMCVK